MTDDRMRELDPRFDAAFQRGAVELRDEPRRGSSATPAPTAATPSVSRPVWDQPRPLSERSEIPRSLSERSETKGTLDVADDVHHESALDVDEPDITTYPRRWEITILVVGIALIAAGLALAWMWIEASFTGFSYSGNEFPAEYVLMQVASHVSTPLITIGLLTLVGLLFLRATRARGRA